MGFHNPPTPWHEMRRRLAGMPRPPAEKEATDAADDELGEVDYPGRKPRRSSVKSAREGSRPSTERRPSVVSETPGIEPGSTDGSWGSDGLTDGSAQTVRGTSGAAEQERPDASAPHVPYVELHAHSAYSFLDGASMPEALVAEAQRLGLEGLALTDHDGFYGAVRMAEAAAAHPESGLQTIYGAELSLGLSAPQNGAADPEGSHVLLLARGQDGYRALAAAITTAQLAGGEKGRPIYDVEALADAVRGHVVVLTGCRKGWVRQALEHDLASARPATDTPILDTPILDTPILDTPTIDTSTQSSCQLLIVEAPESPVALSKVGNSMAQASRALTRLTDLFGHENVYVELFDHGDPLDDARNDALAALASAHALPLVATGNVHYARPEKHRLAQALAAVRARRSIDELESWLPAAPAAHLHSGAEMQRRLGHYPGAIENTLVVARETAFSLRAVKPHLPHLELPGTRTAMQHLTDLVWQAAEVKYPGLPEGHRQRIERELATIETKDFPGYFLIVHDLVQFARSRGILCQGRGSAAASAVCYLLGITSIDAIFYKLPFERFLSTIRDEEPDIDVDFDSDRREEVIQYVYEKYGRTNAAQVANVISYTPRNAVRDMAKALGFGPGQQDAWSKALERGHAPGSDDGIPASVADLAKQLRGYPRHLGIHSGGMVLTREPIGEVVPIEHARMQNRTVLQWDKDDCEWMGLVKFDLLGLGMLSALQRSFDLIDQTFGRRLTLGELPREEPAVYDALCRADAIGIFQVESRAQLGLLPRLKPRSFYDLTIEVALIRPGPIQGGAVHPYVERRAAQAADPSYKPPYPHKDAIPALERTLGVPIFQEQIIAMATALSDLTPEESDLLRRAFGSKRGTERMESLRGKLVAGMRSRGMNEDAIAAVYDQVAAFANFGFAESHSLSFALLVYGSSWLKVHYPAAFLAGLLRAQPMGFYSPATLVADARRHGVEVLRPDIARSGVDPELERRAEGSAADVGNLDAGTVGSPAAAVYREGNGVAAVHHEGNATTPRGAPRLPATPTFVAERGLDSCWGLQPPVGLFDASAPNAYDIAASAPHRRDGAVAVRLGLAAVRGIGRTLAERIVAERDAHGPYLSMQNLARRTDITEAQLESLATAGAFDSLGLARREALWSAGTASRDRSEYLEGSLAAVEVPLFDTPDELETLTADLWATGISPADHRMRHERAWLAERGVLTAAELRTAETGRRVEIAGVVVHRQRPRTAGGVVFLNLEDETGMINVICSAGAWVRFRTVARTSAALVVRGMLERSPEGIVNVLADRFDELHLGMRSVSRDFR